MVMGQKTIRFSSASPASVRENGSPPIGKLTSQDHFTPNTALTSSTGFSLASKRENLFVRLAKLYSTDDKKEVKDMATSTVPYIATRKFRYRPAGECQIPSHNPAWGKDAEWELQVFLDVELALQRVGTCPDTDTVDYELWQKAYAEQSGTGEPYCYKTWNLCPACAFWQTAMIAGDFMGMKGISKLIKAMKKPKTSWVFVVDTEHWQQALIGPVDYRITRGKLLETISGITPIWQATPAVP